MMQTLKLLGKHRCFPFIFPVCHVLNFFEKQHSRIRSRWLTPTRQESPNVISPWEAADPNTWASPDPAPSKDQAFPRMAHHEYLRGSSKDPDLLTGDQNNPLDGKYEENDWARHKSLFTNSRPAQRPTAEQLQTLSFSRQAAVERSREQDGPSFDPNSPYFDAQQCWHDILQKYKCPHKAVCK